MNVCRAATRLSEHPAVPHDRSGSISECQLKNRFGKSSKNTVQPRSVQCHQPCERTECRTVRTVSNTPAIAAVKELITRDIRFPSFCQSNTEAATPPPAFATRFISANSDYAAMVLHCTGDSARETPIFAFSSSQLEPSQRNGRTSPHFCQTSQYPLSRTIGQQEHSRTSRLLSAFQPISLPPRLQTMLSMHFRLAASHLRASAASIGARTPLAAFSSRVDHFRATEEGRKIFVGNLSFKVCVQRLCCGWPLIALRRVRLRDFPGVFNVR